VKFWFRFPASPSSDATRASRRRSLLWAVVLIVVLPLAWRGTSCGQDFDFHLQNWLEIVAHWQHGIFYPHWASSANYLAGEPRFVFYPPLSWLLGGLLGVVLPWTWTPVAFTLIALLAAAFSFYAMACEWMPLDSATIAACLYVVNPYMLFVVYERGALAELLAAVWMPLLVLFALRERRSLIPLALTVAALWLTNAPAAVMGCYTLALIVAVAALQEKSWRLVGRAVCAMPLGLGLAGFWLIPAIYQQRWVEIQRAIGPLMHVENSFLFGYVPLSGVSADERFDATYHNQILHMVSWIAVALIAGAVLAAWLGRRKRSTLWLPMVAVGAAISALQLRWSDFLWRIAPELKYLQFPWRWMLVLGLVFAVLAGIAIRQEQTTRRAVAVRAVLLLSLAGAMAILSSIFFWQPCDDEDNVEAQITTFHATGFEGTDEYTPQGADNSQIQQALPPVRLLKSANAEESSEGDNPAWSADADQEPPAAVKIERWDPEHIAASIISPVPGYAVLRLMDYPAWRVTLNGAEVENRPHRSDGLMVIPVAAGTNGIDVRWHTTRDQWTGIAVSLLALAITLALGWKGRRRLDGSGFR
jgi:hypothetical protein